MMKKSLLPETDLARIALLPDNQKREQLLRVKKGAPTFTYASVREAVPAIFNARPPLMPLQLSKWQDIEAAVKRRCVGRPNSVEPNLKVAKALFTYTQQKAFNAFQWDFMSVPIGRGAKVKLWHDLYFIEDGKPVICYVDPRQISGLNALARDFVFSVMYHNLARGDFAEARFQIFHFPKDSDGERCQGKPYHFDKSRLITEDVINKAIDTTYNIWFEILSEREDETRKNPEAMVGGLFSW